jgi:hypothetical protein
MPLRSPELLLGSRQTRHTPTATHVHVSPPRHTSRHPPRHAECTLDRVGRRQGPPQRPGHTQPHHRQRLLQALAKARRWLVLGLNRGSQPDRGRSPAEKRASHEQCRGVQRRSRYAFTGRGDSRSAANRVRPHESGSSRNRLRGNPGGCVGVVGRMGAPWQRFFWPCRECPDPAGRRRVKRSAYRPFPIPRPSRRSQAARILTHGRWTGSRGAGHDSLRASVGSTEASASIVARFGVVGPTRARPPRGKGCDTIR